MFFSVDRSQKTPLSIQIASALVEQVQRGLLLPGAQLPGSRLLAERLGVHRKTVVAAYEELLAQGWIETRQATGTFVSRQLPAQMPQAMSRVAMASPPNGIGFPFEPDTDLQRPVLVGTNALAFNDGFPDVRLAPLEALSRAIRSVLRSGYRKNLLFYSDFCGELSLRQAMAEYLRDTRGLPIGLDNVLITRGSTMGIYLAARSLLRPGDRVVVGDISYGSANMIFRQMGAELCPVPVDAQGLDVEAIARCCREAPIRMVYVTPHHHYPTTVTMPAERRLRLLQLAQTQRFCILEDDYDYDFHYDCSPVLPLAGSDTLGNVVYVGSLCKAISPALRVGFAVAPAPLVQAMGQYRRVVDRQGDNLLEAALALLFQEGEIRRHLRRAQRIYQQRRDLFCDMLRRELTDYLDFATPTGGMAVWARFHPRIALPVLAQRARGKGLLMSDGSNYAPGMNASRLGFAALDAEEMRQGMDILKACLRDWP
jgi:GntR family transcriptional regulator/MocR family aminotransferase